MRRSPWIRATAVVCGTTMLGGCYMYSTVGVSDVSVGSTVRAHVTEAVAERADTVVGYHATTFVGEVTARDAGGGLLLRVPGQVFTNSGQTHRYHPQIRLLPSDVLDLQARKLNATRTGALVALGVAAAVIIVKSVFSGQTGGIPPSGGGTGPVNAMVTPIH